MISWPSVLSALFYCSVVLILASLLRYSTLVLKRCGVSVLLLAAALAIVRLFLPFELPFTHIVRSWTLLGVPQRFLNTYPAVGGLLLAVWAVGALIVAGRDLRSFRRAQARCGGYAVVEDERVGQIARRMSIDCPVVVSPDVKIPYAAGLFRHVIYLPEERLSDRDVELILAHEAQHIRSHDAQIKLLVCVLTAIQWWNPAIWLFRREIGAILEFRCDAKVVESMDGRGRQQYLDMLMGIAKRLTGGEPVPALNESPVVLGSSVLEQRFEVMLAYRGRPPRRTGAAAQCVFVALFLISYLVIFQPAGAPPAEEFQNDAGTYYEERYDGPERGDSANSAFILKGSDGRYELFVDYRFSRYLTQEEIGSDEYQHLRVFEEGTAE